MPRPSGLVACASIVGGVGVRSAVHPALLDGRDLALVSRVAGRGKYCRRRAQDERDGESEFRLGRHGIVSFLLKSAGVPLRIAELSPVLAHRFAVRRTTPK